MMGKQRQGSNRTGWRALASTVPADHILRRIDRLIDVGELRNVLALHDSQRGRLSIAPELLIRMTLIGRLYRITSERRLCEEVRFNLAHRWFCQLPLDANVPHHSTFVCGNAPRDRTDLQLVNGLRSRGLSLLEQVHIGFSPS